MNSNEKILVNADCKLKLENSVLNNATGSELETVVPVSVSTAEPVVTNANTASESTILCRINVDDLTSWITTLNEVNNVDPTPWLALIIAAITALIAHWAFQISKDAHQFSKDANQWNDENQQAQLYLLLRQRYLQLRPKMPEQAFTIRNNNVDEADKKQLTLNAQHFWHLVYDEWYATTQLNNGRYSDLWEVYFAESTKSTLKYQFMEEVLDEMLKKEIAFGSQRDKFKKVIDKLKESTEKTDNKLEK